jgi:hypothetical protein
MRRPLLGGLALTLCLLVHAAAAGAATGERVTVFGDSAATAIAYDPEAKKILGRGLDLRLEVAACRRLGDLSCPYDGERPANVIERATALGSELGRVVVVLVGYNDYETRYALNIEKALAAFRAAGVERVLWATLRAERQSYLTMNEAILDAAARSPTMTVLDWNELSRGRPDWIQGDGIHLTALGAQAMATMVSDALVRLGVAPRPAAAVRSLAIRRTALPPGRLGRSFSTRLRAAGGTGPYRWLRAGGVLPSGLRLTTLGRLTGVPTRAGAFRLRVRVVDRTGASHTSTIVVRIAA